MIIFFTYSMQPLEGDPTNPHTSMVNSHAGTLSWQGLAGTGTSIAGEQRRYLAEDDHVELTSTQLLALHPHTGVVVM